MPDRPAPAEIPAETVGPGDSPGEEPGVLREGLAEAFEWDAALPRTLWRLAVDTPAVARAAVGRERDARGRDRFVSPWRMLFGLTGAVIAAEALLVRVLGLPPDPLLAGGALHAQCRTAFLAAGLAPAAAEAAVATTFDRLALLLPGLMAAACVPVAGLAAALSRRSFRAHLLALVTATNAGYLANLLAVPLGLADLNLLGVVALAAWSGYVLWTTAALCSSGPRLRRAAAGVGVWAALLVANQLLLLPAIAAAAASAVLLP